MTAQRIIPDGEDKSVATEFSQIQIGLRIIPSHNEEANMIIMVPDKGQAEWQWEYDEDFNDDITDEFFRTDNMTDYFPDMFFTKEHTPLGSSNPFCLHLDWITRKNKLQKDRYFTVRDFDTCAQAKNQKYRWQENDPKDGQDIYLWKQHSTKAAYADDCDEYSIFVKSKVENGGTCYSYEVIKSVCVAIEFRADAETSTYGWHYVGGCFEDGRVNNYKWATPGTEYQFDKLDFEVREYIGGTTVGFLGLIFGYLSLLFLGLGILFAVIYACSFTQRQIKKRSATSEKNDKEKPQRFEDEAD